jgi:hypothetical protein
VVAAVRGASTATSGEQASAGKSTVAANRPELQQIDGGDLKSFVTVELQSKSGQGAASSTD